MNDYCLSEARRAGRPLMHALIIEPERFTAQLIQDCLADLGFTSFAFAVDEDEAIDRAWTRCPDLITADVTLASGCGVNAVQRICDSVAIAVLYVTATASEVRQRCPTAAIVQKPFSITELVQGVQTARQSSTILPGSTKLRLS